MKFLGYESNTFVAMGVLSSLVCDYFYLSNANNFHIKELSHYYKIFYLMAKKKDLNFNEISYRI